MLNSYAKYMLNTLNNLMTLELVWEQNELQIIYMEFNHYQHGIRHDNKR